MCSDCEGWAYTEVPDEGQYLVIDGKVYDFTFDSKGYAGPHVHLIVTTEPLEV